MRGPPRERSPAQLLGFGVCNLDKPPGPSAHQVADWVRRFVADALERHGDSPIDRVAHAGTLDPKVTGSLPLLLGDATRMARVFDESVKEYVAVLQLHGPAPTDLGRVLGEFESELYQRPPRKSAVKRRRRVREVYELSELDRDGRQVLVRVRCESGTYVRKLCHDIGLALGTGAHMGDLRRVRTGQFDDASLVTMETLVDALEFWLEDDTDPASGEEGTGPLSGVVEPAERALVELPRVTIAENAAREVANGAPVYAPGVLEVEPPERPPASEGEASSTDTTGSAVPHDGRLVACYTPAGGAVCLGSLTGEPDADSGVVVDLERVLL